MSKPVNQTAETSSLPESLTVSVEEAAKLLGIGRNMAYDAVRTGQLPSIKFGKRILVPRHKLAALIGPIRDAPAQRVPAPLSQAADRPAPATFVLPTPSSAIGPEEPRTMRADSEGLLNEDYILANASKFKKVSAVYFLTSVDEIVYVGQASDVYARVSQHIYEGTKRFSHVFMLRCDRADLDDLERRYIKKFRPMYNFMNNLLSDTRAAPLIQTAVADAEIEARDDR